jgi:glycosyltransferase involved in cell wall biosynthesis
MRIVIVCDHAHINGGQAKVAIDSAKGLSRRGYRVDFFAAVGPIDPGLLGAGVAVTLLEQPDVTSASSLTRFGAQWLWNAPAAHRLAALLSECDPFDTIVHVHGWAKALSPSIGWALRRSRLPIVHTLHEFYLVCPNGGFYDYHAARNCDFHPMSLGCIAHDCDSRGYHRKLMRVGRHALMLHVSGLYDTARHVITISKLQRQVASPYLPKDAVFYDVANPIDAEALGPKGEAPLEAPLGDFLFVGRVSAEKGARYFAQAARLAGVKAVFAGDGPQLEELRGEFPEARFLGWRTPGEVRDLMRSARALVFPSVWYEGQPLTVYEALALGTPVIVSDLCAGREAVRDGENGLWFKSADALSLASAMRRLLDEPAARRMAQAAYDIYWADPLTLDRHLDGVGAVYEQARAAHMIS